MNPSYSQHPFEIKNYRLLSTGQGDNLNQQQNPNIYTMNNQQYQLSEQFNSLYVGYNLMNLGLVKFKNNGSLENVTIDFQVYLEERKIQVIREQKTFKNITNKSQMQIPCEIELKIKDNYIFYYAIHYKEAPFLQTNAAENKVQEQKWSKKFRIQPSFPFEIYPPRLCPWLAPNYYLEYFITNISKEQLQIKNLKFLAKNPFESVKIQNSDSNVISLENQERENLIFKISVQPSRVTEYEQICSEKQDQHIEIGNVSFSWGNCGYYEGIQIPLKIRPYDLVVEFAEGQEQLLEQGLQHEKICEVCLRISSGVKINKDVRVGFEQKEMGGIKIVGSDIKHFKLGGDKEFQILKLFVLPVLSGIQYITGLQFLYEDKSGGRDRKYIWNNNLCVKIPAGTQGIQEYNGSQQQQQIVDDLI